MISMKKISSVATVLLVYWLDMIVQLICMSE